MNTESRDHLAEWVARERAEYADVKWAEDGENRRALVEAMEAGDWQRWIDFAGNYLARARTFGFDTPHGRQALGKATVTLLHMTETAIDLFGPMPEPGVPSGEIRDA